MTVACILEQSVKSGNGTSASQYDALTPSSVTALKRFVRSKVKGEAESEDIVEPTRAK